MKQIFKRVKEHSSSKKYTYGKVYLPKEWIGKTVKVILIEKNGG